MFPDSYIKFQSDSVSPDTPVVICLSEPELFDRFLEVYNDLRKKTEFVTIISLNYYLHPLLEKHGLEYQNIYDFAKPEDYFELKGKAEALAKTWYLNGDRDITEYEGFSLGMALEYGVGIFFQKIFKATRDSEIFFKKIKPQVLILLTQVEPEISFYIFDVEKNLYQRILKSLANKLDVALYEIKYPKKKLENSVFDAIRSQLKFYSTTLPGFKKGLFLPQFIVSALKQVFILVNNIVFSLNRRPDLSNILFSSANTVNYFGNHLIQKIRDSPKYNIFIYQGESRSLKMKIERCLIFKLVLALKKKEFQKFEEFAANPDIEKKLSFQGIPLLSLFKKEFISIFEKEMTQAWADFKSYQYIMKSRSIRLLLVTSDLPARERTAVLTANQLGIPSINLQHGIEGQAHSTPLGFPRKASHKAAWSHKKKDWLVKMGENPDSITVVGCTLLRESVSNNKQASFDFYAPGYLVYFSHPGQQFLPDRQLHVSQNERIMRILLEVMKKIPQKTLVIKTRPMDEQSFLYKKWIEESQGKNIIVTDSGLLSWIVASDLFLTIFSTAGAEAMVFDKPGITFGFVEQEKVALYNNTGQTDVPFAESGATLDLDVEDSDKLVQLVKSIYQSSDTREKLEKGRKRFLKEYCNVGEENPGEEFLKLMEKLIELQDNP